jgi:hypothetical protein
MLLSDTPVLKFRANTNYCDITEHLDSDAIMSNLLDQCHSLLNCEKSMTKVSNSDFINTYVAIESFQKNKDAGLKSLDYYLPLGRSEQLPEDLQYFLAMAG